ncbi:hypothetical protein V8C37DRAFT_123987 [Trichoderma ceciliae]
MPGSGNREGRCAECGCSNEEHEFGPCLGESTDKKSKRAVRCKFEWSQCLAATHSERVDCLTCPKHPNDKPRSFRTKARTKTATEWGDSNLESGDEEVVIEKGKKKKKADDKTGNQDSFPKKKEKTTESNDGKLSHGKDQRGQNEQNEQNEQKGQKGQKGMKNEPSNSVIPKSSAAKALGLETQESSGDELAWDQDKAEEDALAQQMQQLSLRKARDKRSDDPDMVEWKRVRAWCKDDEVVYFWDPETGNKQRTMLTAWTEETRKFGKAKKECLVFYSRKDRRTFYCESFEDEELEADI